MTECKNCKKELHENSDIEYSRETGDFFCNPDCATDYYYSYMASRPVTFKEMKEIQGNPSSSIKQSDKTGEK